MGNMLSNELGASKQTLTQNLHSSESSNNAYRQINNYPNNWHMSLTPQERWLANSVIIHAGSSEIKTKYNNKPIVKIDYIKKEDINMIVISVIINDYTWELFKNSNANTKQKVINKFLVEGFIERAESEVFYKPLGTLEFQKLSHAIHLAKNLAASDSEFAETLKSIDKDVEDKIMQRNRRELNQSAESSSSSIEDSEDDDEYPLNRPLPPANSYVATLKETSLWFLCQAIGSPGLVTRCSLDNNKTIFKVKFPVNLAEVPKVFTNNWSNNMVKYIFELATFKPTPNDKDILTLTLDNSEIKYLESLRNYYIKDSIPYRINMRVGTKYPGKFFTLVPEDSNCDTSLYHSAVEDHSTTHSETTSRPLTTTNSGNIRKVGNTRSLADEVWMYKVLARKHEVDIIDQRGEKMAILRLPLITDENYKEYVWETIKTKQDVKEALYRLGFREENNCLVNIMPGRYFIYELWRKANFFFKEKAKTQGHSN